MTGDREILTRLVEYHAHIAVPATDVADDVRRGRRRLRRHRALATGAVAVAVTGIAVAATLVAGGRAVERSQPVAPRPSADPSFPMATEGWTGPLRPSESLPVVQMGTEGWTDGTDATFGGVDIRVVQQSSGQRLSWSMELREAPPRAATLDPRHRVIEYGIVVDTDGDWVADCQIGINNVAPARGDFRVWVTNLRTGVTDDQVGPPYGYPVEFAHPDETGTGEGPPIPPTMRFVFLTSTSPCRTFGAYTRLYAWASVTDDGRVVAWDYAPDAAWLAMRY